jgi:hypothetical protein
MTVFLFFSFLFFSFLFFSFLWLILRLYACCYKDVPTGPPVIADFDSDGYNDIVIQVLGSLHRV